MMRILFFLLGISLLGSCKNSEKSGQASDNTAVATTVSAKDSEKNVEDSNLAKIITEPFSVNYVMGKFDPKTHSDFATIDAKYADEKGYRLRKDAYESFLAMHAEALKAGIDLKILSATRPFYRQKQIWEAKWNGARKVDGQDLSKTIADPKERALKILTYSSMPGTSRHHWGTEIDLNSLEPIYFESGRGAEIYAWLDANASTFGYCQPYSPKGDERPHGYNEEKWHWSYNPISLKLTNLAKDSLKNEMISGFAGSEAAPQIDVVTKYVLGINHACKH